ncbi:MAG: hypothetical protein HXO58_07205 [Rothia mucilaginosa]|uniref:Uncharacterized protein n=1 Tax=Rothia mucilaginosa TaxID=43675 RepID=A0A930L668_9MICC|nr:hypothetical protein [Rothia mucilaginosa]MBF1659606.1 hypothetical protein [Rothia mucilaginosa]
MHTTDTPLGRHIATTTRILNTLGTVHVVARESDAYIITAGMRSAHIFVDQDGLILTTIIGEDVPAADWMDGEISPEQTAIALSPDTVAASIVRVADDGGYSWDASHSGDIVCISIETPETVEIILYRGGAWLGEHPLSVTSDTVRVTEENLPGIIEAAQMAYAQPHIAWLSLCEAYDEAPWDEIVDALGRAEISERDHLTHVADPFTSSAALVEECDDHCVVTDLDPLSLSQYVCWSHVETAAYVLATVA